MFSALSRKRLLAREVSNQPMFEQVRPDFREVFDTHIDAVWRTLLRLGIPEHAADDAAQDVFLIVHDKLEEFEGRSKLSTWIYAVTYRVAQNYRRRSVLRRHEELAESAVCPGPGPERSLAAQQEVEFVARVCERLSDAKRDVFVLSVIEQRPVPEVAQLLGVKLNTIYSRLRATRLAFQAALSEWESTSAPHDQEPSRTEEEKQP